MTQTPAPQAPAALAQAWRGLLLVIRRKTLRGLAIAYSLYEVSWGVLVVAVPVSAARHYPGGAGAAAAGMLWASLGLVGAVAALVTGHRRTAGRERGVMAFGMLATAWNLLPFGQLDGGHVTHAVIGQRSRYFSIATVACVVILCFFSVFLYLFDPIG